MHRMKDTMDLMKRWFDLELAAWVAGLLYLALIDPGADRHFSFCVFKYLGFDFCPGCGLGHSIAYLLEGNIAASLQAHVLGIPALAIISLRIVTLIRNRIHCMHIFQACPIKTRE